MSETNSNAVDVIVQSVIDAVDKRLGDADFDKSQTGVVTAVNGNEYTIAVFGSKYTITSDQVFTVGQSVVVTALQGDMKRLVCSPDNVGTMNTVNKQVKTVEDKLNNFIDTDFSDTVDHIEKIQDQVDGSFVSWFYDGMPTLTNAPANEWTTEDAKRLHVGDLYYDTSSGFSYEWARQNGNYSWEKITDSGIQTALKAASTAQDTADGKRRTFYDTPSPPYDRGDLWAQGGTGDLKIASRKRIITDSFHADDWVLASKYTDDTVANRAEGKADKAQESADKANTDLTNFRTEYDSDLKVTKEAIEARVTKTDYATDKSGIENRISMAESNITQTSDKIESQVWNENLDGSKVISSINQTADSVTINASHINLKGAVTTDSISTAGLDASVITAGKINAERLDLTGDITMGSDGKITIGENVITADNIKSGQIFQLIWENVSEEDFSSQQLIIEKVGEYSEFLFVFKGYKSDVVKNKNTSGELVSTDYFMSKTTLIIPSDDIQLDSTADEIISGKIYSVFINFPFAHYWVKSNGNGVDLGKGTAVSAYRTMLCGIFNRSQLQDPEIYPDNWKALMVNFFDAYATRDDFWDGGTFVMNEYVIPYKIYGIK